MTRLVAAIRALNKAMGDRPWLILYDQTHGSQDQAKICGQYGGGFVAAMGLAALAPMCVRQIGTAKDEPETPTGGVDVSNSYGNDNRGIRRFLRESHIPPTVANVERMAREVRRSPSENEAVVRRAKEQGGPALVDRQGRDAKEVARREVKRSIAARPIPKSRGVR